MSPGQQTLSVDLSRISPLGAANVQTFYFFTLLLVQVEEDRSHRQQLLDIIIDALWVLKRNKLLTSGLVYIIALHMMMTISKVSDLPLALCLSDIKAYCM